MAKPAEDAEFDKENKKNGVVHAESDAAFGFPSEFPYEFDSFGTETESSDEEDFFAGLSRRLSHASLHETRKQLTVSEVNISSPSFQDSNTALCLFFFWLMKFWRFRRARRRLGA